MATKGEGTATDLPDTDLCFRIVQAIILRYMDDVKVEDNVSILSNISTHVKNAAVFTNDVYDMYLYAILMTY